MSCEFTPDSISKGKQWWKEPTDTSEPCPRDTWDNSDRCIWHTREQNKTEREIQQAIVDESEDSIDFAYLEDADVKGVDFQGINFRSANFAGVNFDQAEFGGANYFGSSFETVDLSGKDLYASTFHYCNFEQADLSEAELELVEFNHSNLRRANLERIKCSQTKFTKTNLEGAILTGSLLTQASFEDAKLLDAVIDNAKISERTFDKTCYYEKEKEWRNAANVYRSLTTLTRENSIPQLARKFYFQQKQCQRRNFRSKGGIRSIEQIQNTIAWIRAEGARFLTGYGDRPGRVIASWGLLIIGWTFVFIRIEGIERDGVTIEPNTYGNLIDYLYFSISTFTPLGNNNLQPASTFAQILAMSEALVGALFIALLVFVLGRRITW